MQGLRKWSMNLISYQCSNWQLTQWAYLVEVWFSCVCQGVGKELRCYILCFVGNQTHWSRFLLFPAWQVKINWFLFCVFQWHHDQVLYIEFVLRELSKDLNQIIFLHLKNDYPTHLSRFTKWCVPLLGVPWGLVFPLLLGCHYKRLKTGPIVEIMFIECYHQLKNW